jgi:hypothetical protein
MTAPVMLGPAMRADLIIDMDGKPGQTYRVIDDFYQDLAYKLVDTPGLRGLPGMWVARPDAQTPSRYRPSRLTVEQYRAQWKLPREHPMTAPGYSERRSGLAKQIGLGRGRRASLEEPEPVAPETVPAPQTRSRRRGRSRSATTAT